MTEQIPPPVKRRFLALPSTRLGWWSVRIALGAVAIAFLSTLLLQLRGEEEEDTFTVWYAITLVIGFGQVVGGITAFVLALTAILRRDERSVLCLLPVFVGLFWLLFIAAEVLVGHD
jgi:uncharacterized membrane protein